MSATRGMAAALRTGVAAALAERSPGFDIIAFMDADLTHAPEDLPRLVAPLVEDRADFVLGSRYVPGGRMRGVPWPRRAISILGNAAVRITLARPQERLLQRGVYACVLAGLRATGGPPVAASTCGRLACPKQLCPS